MYRIACVFLLCISALQAAYRDCGSEIGHVTAILVNEDCDENTHTCVLVRDTNATIKITFNIDRDVNTVRAVMHGVLAGVPVPFEIPHPDVCAADDSGITCPLSPANGPFTYVVKLHVEPSNPRYSIPTESVMNGELGVSQMCLSQIALNVRWELKNEESKNMLCVDIPVQIA